MSFILIKNQFRFQLNLVAIWKKKGYSTLDSSIFYTHYIP